MKTKNTFIVIGLVTAIVLTITTSARAATWTQKADMPTARVFLASSAVDGKIYAIGGLTVYRGTRLATVEVYDPVTDTWTKKADMPTPRDRLATNVINGRIYAIGGGSDGNKVEEYDPATDTWTERADMPTPRGALATSVVNGKIYAIGGGPSGAMVATVEEYDPATDTWTKKADMPTARKLLSSSVVNGKIYAIGGQSPSVFPAFPTVEEYDPVTDTWTKKADMPTPRNWMSTSVMNEKIYAFGGNTSRGGSPISTLTQYEPTTDTWTAKDDMPVRIGGLSTSVVGGKIYVIGGTSASYPYSTSLSTVWEYDTGLRVSSPDINGDGVVDGADFSIMVDHWNMDEPLCDIAPAPFGDDIVDVQDLVLLSEYLLNELDDPTLVAHWALDESEGDIVFDSAGINDAFVIGDPLWQPDGGIVNGAIQLDGVDDYIITFPVLNPANGPFSVLSWINGGAAGQTIVSELSGANWLSTDPLNGSLITELKASGRSGVPLLSETIITDGDWHRIGFVWDGSYRTLYVDSIAVAQDMQDGLENSSKSLHIGTSNNMEIGTFWSGLIDDVRIYNRAVRP
ncbi:MAG: Kelch repeat-containing protein [Planctomycetota bacterium]